MVELDKMSEEQLKMLQSFLAASIREAEIEEGWREGESDETLPLLRGLMHYISTEYLGEEPDDEFKYVDHDGDDNSDDLSF
jgi:hypothetical protein